MVETKDGDLLQEQVLSQEESEELKIREGEQVEQDEALLIEERINFLVEKIFAAAPLVPAAGEGESIEELARVATNGLEKTSNAIEEVAESVKKGKGIMEIFEEASGWFSKLSSIYSGGKGVYEMFKFIRDFGKPTEFEQIMAKLDEISQQLRKVESAVQQGFADLIAHNDFADFRKEVDKPTQILFDRYMRCFAVSGEIPIKDFKKDCEESYVPRHILSTIYSFLTTKSNIFATQLKADKYVYSTFKTWMDTVFHHSIRLIIVNLFYYGLVTAESPEEKKKEMENFGKDETKDLLGQMVRMAQRLSEIDLERIKTANSTKTSEQWIKNTFAKIKVTKPDSNGNFSKEYLGNIANEFKELWKSVNGPQDFYVAVSAGKHNSNSGEVTAPSEARPDIGEAKDRYAAYHNGDPERVALVRNIVDWSNLHLSLILIQPLTKESVDVNRKYQPILEQFHQGFASVQKAFLNDLKQFVSRIKEPLLLVHSYTTITSTQRDLPSDVAVRDNAFESIGDASSTSNSEWSIPKKYDWYVGLNYWPGNYIYTHFSAMAIF